MGSRKTYRKPDGVYRDDDDARLLKEQESWRAAMYSLFDRIDAKKEESHGEPGRACTP